MKQKETKIITGQIVVRTGLHIGGGNGRVEIGGIDAPVIKNPVSNDPYIPGSSIKGKMRSLLEWKEGKVKESGGEPCSCGKPDCPICRVFGCRNGKESAEGKLRGPSRLLVRDAEIAPESKEEKTKKPILEEKSENSIDRITAVAKPRQMERVVPGVRFDFEMVYRIIDMGDDGKHDKEFFDSVVLEGLRLLQNDYLGGSGSRGYGRIEFINLKDGGKPFSL